jgi:hypothetical protein
VKRPPYASKPPPDEIRWCVVESFEWVSREIDSAALSAGRGEAGERTSGEGRPPTSERDDDDDERERFLLFHGR